MQNLPQTASETDARVTVENIRCSLDASEDTCPLVKHYYICTLQHKTTIYVTRFAQTNKRGSIHFGGFFIFDNVTNTFNIKVKLYRVTILQETRNCLTLPFLKSPLKLPMMEFVGKGHIVILNVKKKKIMLKNDGSLKSLQCNMIACIDVSLNWPEPLKGFLTIGTGRLDQQPVWNRRWCVLEDAKLLYYNFPCQENVHSPVGIIDLQQCKGCDKSDFNYLSKKTLRLFLDDGKDFKRILICPDNHKDYELWFKNFHIVLTLSQQWDVLKGK